MKGRSKKIMRELAGGRRGRTTATEGK